MAGRVQSLAREVRQVWAGGVEAETERVRAALEAAGAGATVAFAIALPGDLAGLAPAGRPAGHAALLESTELLRPLQLGLALGGDDGALRGAWSFNLHFDVASSLHTEAGLEALRADGVDLARHAADGIQVSALQAQLCLLPLLNDPQTAPRWVTFSGTKAFGHLLKLLTSRPLPSDVDAYSDALAWHCPFRHELEPQQPEHAAETHAAGGRALAALTLYTHRRQRAGAWLGDATGDTTASRSGDDRAAADASLAGAEPAAAATCLWATAARIAMSAGAARRTPLAAAGATPA